MASSSTLSTFGVACMRLLSRSSPMVLSSRAPSRVTSRLFDGARAASSSSSSSSPSPSPSDKNDMDSSSLDPALAQSITGSHTKIPAAFLAVPVVPRTHSVHVATLHLRCYGDTLPNLDFFVDFARRVAHALGIPCSDVAYLPTQISRWTVPRSPFVHKKSQENFERRTHKRALKLWDADEEVVDRFMLFLRLHAMPGLGMKAQIFRHRELGVGERMLAEAKAEQRSLDEPGTAASDASEKLTEADLLPSSTGPASPQEVEEEVRRLADQFVASEMAAEAREDEGRAEENVERNTGAESSKAEKAGSKQGGEEGR